MPIQIKCTICVSTEEEMIKHHSPFSTSKSTIANCPHLLATCRGVMLCLAALPGSAPADNKALATPTLP